MKATVPTEEKTIAALVRSWPRVHVAFEEGTQAQDVLIDQVERVVVCTGKGPLTNKDDRIDADGMSEKLRVGDLKPVFYGAPEILALKELVRNYNNLVGDSTRVTLRIKAIYRPERSSRRECRCIGHRSGSTGWRSSDEFHGVTPSLFARRQVTDGQQLTGMPIWAPRDRLSYSAERR